MTENEKTNLSDQNSQCINCNGCQNIKCVLHKDNMIALCDIVLSFTRGDDWKLYDSGIVSKGATENIQ